MDDQEDQEVVLPGFRFYPTDEELVGFYLKRKIGKKPISMELIKEIDIYKFDPWDLPKACTVGDNEWYFYCKRGRKYRNSVRPNRVTGSGFWKATGIDKPLYSSATGSQAETRRECIGLKKSLVYYRGSAGKGTKTDWMMHEFRLPDQPSAKTNTLEAEVWTLCRIFKRSATYRKYTSNWREISTKRDNTMTTTTTTTSTTTNSTKTCCVESTTPESTYISFGGNYDHVGAGHTVSTERPDQGQMMVNNNSTSQAPFMTSSSSYPSFSNVDESKKNEFFTTNDHWDELGAILGVYVNPFTL